MTIQEKISQELETAKLNFKTLQACETILNYWNNRENYPTVNQYGIKAKLFNSYKEKLVSYAQLSINLDDIKHYEDMHDTKLTELKKAVNLYYKNEDFAINTIVELSRQEVTK